MSTSSARSSSNKKASSKKKGTGKKSSKKGVNSQISIADFVGAQEFKATVIFVIGLLLLIVAIAPGSPDSVWNNIHTFYFALFGVCGFYLPPSLLYLGVINVLNIQTGKHYLKLFELFTLFALICGFVHINKFVPENIELGFGEALGKIYTDVFDKITDARSSGGLVGGIFGGALYAIGHSRALANVLSTILLIANLMFLFGVTLMRLISGVQKPAKRVGKLAGEAIESVKNDASEIKRTANEGIVAVKSRRKNDPITVVNDFYSADEAQAVSTQEPEHKRKKENDSESHSIFDMIFNPPEQENASQTSANEKPTRGNDASDETSYADNVVPFTAVNSVSQTTPDEFVLGAPEDIATGKKPERAEPLSEQEEALLHSELDNAVQEPPVIQYKYPPVDCLKPPKIGEKAFDPEELKANGEKLISSLNSFNVSATIVDVVPGPTVTRYELSPAPGVKISKFVGLSDDLALHMAAPAGLRIEAPIPNKAAIGIEIPNRKKTTVSFREIIDNDSFMNAKSKLNVALGKDISGNAVFSDLAKMPHLLVAGTTGSGKSVCLNTMIVSLLYNASPDEVKILLIDPKQVEFGVYNGLPHLLVPVVSDPRKASGALGWAVTEMLSRYKTLNANGVRDIGAYNSLCEEREDLAKMPQIVIFIDELSDLMTVAPAEVEDSIQRLAQMARAAGMHLVVATQRPSVDVITGVIKANIPSRIALTVKSQIDSRTIIDSAGAEKLMGYGDMLYYPVGIPKPIRVQGAFLTDVEIENVVSFIKANGSASYDDAVQQEIERQAVAEKKKGSSSDDSGSGKLDKNDELLMRAVELFVGTPEKASISALQRHLGLGFAKAGRLMDTLEEKGIVGPTEGSKPRKVLITKQQWYEMNAMSSEVTDGTVPSSAADSDFTEDTVTEQ